MRERNNEKFPFHLPLQDWPSALLCRALVKRKKRPTHSPFAPSPRLRNYSLGLVLEEFKFFAFLAAAAASLFKCLLKLCSDLMSSSVMGGIAAAISRLIWMKRVSQYNGLRCLGFIASEDSGFARGA
jgi:hypothetical protein